MRSPVARSSLRSNISRFYSKTSTVAGQFSPSPYYSKTSALFYPQRKLALEGPFESSHSLITWAPAYTRLSQEELLETNAPFSLIVLDKKPEAEVQWEKDFTIGNLGNPPKPTTFETVFSKVAEAPQYILQPAAVLVNGFVESVGKFILFCKKSFA